MKLINNCKLVNNSMILFYEMYEKLQVTLNTFKHMVNTALGAMQKILYLRS